MREREEEYTTHLTISTSSEKEQIPTSGIDDNTLLNISSVLSVHPVAPLPAAGTVTTGPLRGLETGDLPTLLLAKPPFCFTLREAIRVVPGEKMKERKEGKRKKLNYMHILYYSIKQKGSLYSICYIRYKRGSVHTHMLYHWTHILH